MKNKTLVLMSAAIITTAAIVLTAGLSLLHGSALEDSPMPEESVVPVSEMTETETVENDVVEIEPDSDDINVIVAENDLIIDIFENSTGKIVGRVKITDDEIYNAYCDLFEEMFVTNCGYANQCFDPHDENATPVCLPEAEYRIEVFCAERIKIDPDTGYCWGKSIAAIGYSYGSEESIWEFVQTGLTFYGGEEVIAVIDGYIADEMVKVQNGTAEVPEDTMAKLVRFDEGDGYWSSVERYTERFPYLAD